jgi:RimJ/RimL family protein N-acetyltransferase
MTKAILEIGRRDKKTKLIYLTVFSTNRIAQSLYRKSGFKKVATLRRRLQCKGRLVDEIVMDLK